MTRLAFCFVSFACAAPGAAQTDRFAAIAARMEQFVADGEIAGVVTLVATPDKIVHLAAVGKADVAADQPMTTEAMFGIMSMTKPITATALMMLVDEGKIALDDPVEKYIPEFTQAKTTGGEAVRGLLVRHVLTHTSGLTGDQSCRDSLEATAKTLAERPFDFQPGERWAYGPSINVCGRLVEIASGQSFEEFLAERIFDPVGMGDTTFHLNDEERGRIATLYERTERGELKPAQRWSGVGEPDAVPNPSGGLFSTAGDMARFYQAMLGGCDCNGAPHLSDEALKLMTETQTGDLVTGFTPGNGWGFGWCVVRKPQGVTEMLSPGTFGHGGAYGTQGWVDPVTKTIYVLMIQRSNLPNSDASDIRREFQRLAAEALGAHR
jgi:CubicO group peptidase (beta-lactamase class C family)